MSNDASTLDSTRLALEEIQRQTRENPQSEVLRRYADQSPAFLAPRMAATQNMFAMYEDQRKRTYDSHKAEMKLLGVEVAEFEPMGDFSIVGDTYNVVPAQPAPAQPATPGGASGVGGTGGSAGTTPTTPGGTTPTTGMPPAGTTPATPPNGTTATPTKPNGVSSWLWPAVIGAGVLGAGAGGLGLYNWYNGEPDNVTINQTGEQQDWKLGIKVLHGPPQ